MFRTTLLAIVTTIMLTPLSHANHHAWRDKLSCQEEDPMPSPQICFEEFLFDTGDIFNYSEESRVVFEQEFRGWPKEYNGTVTSRVTVHLSSESVLPKGSMIRITNLSTGKSEYKRDFESVLIDGIDDSIGDETGWLRPPPNAVKRVIMLDSSSPTFKLEFIAPPNSFIRVLFEKVYLPYPSRHIEILPPRYLGYVPNKNICGSEDDRELFSSSAIARLLRGESPGCTAFIADCPAGPDKCMISAGHCLVAGLQPSLQADRAEFNVPASDPITCDITHPSPESCFSIDKSTVLAINAFGDNDWAVFRLAPNAVTDKTAFEQQGSSISLRSAALPAVGSTLRLRGYGVDASEAAICSGDCVPGQGARNQVLQTSSGPLSSFTAGSIVSYEIDSCGGNSGSPVTYFDQAIAINTLGSCSSEPGTSNTGTDIQHPVLSRALGNVFDISDSNIADRDVAMNASGDGVIVWEDSLNGRVKVRRLRPSLIMEPEEQFSNLSAPFPSPKVDISPSGLFVVVYDAWDGLSGQTHNDDGTVIASSFPLGTASVPRSHDVAVSPSGDFSTIWMVQKGVTGTFLQIRRFSFLGAPLADAADVVEIDEPAFTATSIQSNNSGTSLVLWQESNSNAQARVYSSSALPISPVFYISSTSAELLDDGTIIAPSIIEGTGFDSDKIVGQRYSLSGTPIGQPIDLLLPSLNYFPGVVESDPRIVSMHSSGFFLTWTRPQDTVMARQFYLNGTPIADPFDLSPGINPDADEYVRAARNAGIFVLSGSKAQFILKSSDEVVIENATNIFSDGFESGDVSRWSNAIGI